MNHGGTIFRQATAWQVEERGEGELIGFASARRCRQNQPAVASEEEEWKHFFSPCLCALRG